jgi:hypothetical protein
MELPRHKLVIFTDSGPDELCPIARGAQLDGRELLIPGDYTIDVSIGDTTPLTATVPILVSGVEYRERTPKETKQPRAWGRLFPLRRLRRR